MIKSTHVEGNFKTSSRIHVEIIAEKTEAITNTHHEYSGFNALNNDIRKANIAIVIDMIISIVFTRALDVEPNMFNNDVVSLVTSSHLSFES
ncbi:MAG: hypothetical protein QXZ31_11410 [Thermofilaceae archaeon]